MHCYRLTFTAPLHVDSRGNAFYEESNSFIHSDTLSAAILATWALVTPDTVAQQAQAPCFKLSSAFPFYDDCYFLPRAISSQAIQLPGDRLKDAKKLKKLQWLDVPLWQASFNVPSWANAIDLDKGICQGIFASQTTTLPAKLWVEEERPRLAMDRMSNQGQDGQIFNFSRIWFHDQGGLYFLAEFTDAQSRQQFETVLSVLGDSGVGADRSNGNGTFKWESGHIPELKPADHTLAVALSLVNPTPSDCQSGWLDNAAYKLVSRGGWVGSTGLRKQRVRMFTEGSVFKQALQGRMVDVSTGYSTQKVYRDGRGFFVKAG